MVLKVKVMVLKKIIIAVITDYHNNDLHKLMITIFV